MLAKILKGIRENDQEFLKEHLPLIKTLYEENATHHTVCTAPCCGCNFHTSIYDVLVAQVDVFPEQPPSALEMCVTDTSFVLLESTKKQLEHLDCLEFLIKSGAVDPNAVIQKSKTKTILLLGCLNLASWPYEHLRADYVFSQTSLATLQDFKDEQGQTVAHYIYFMHCAPEKKILQSWWDKLAECDFTVQKGPKPLFYLATLDLDLERLPLFLKTQNPNHYLTSRESNALQYLLYDYRFVKSSQTLKAIAAVAQVLIDAGIHLDHTDKDGCNVLDYVYRYKWETTQCGQAIMRATKDLKPTGNVASTEDWKVHWKVDPKSMSAGMQLLFDHRYVKDNKAIERVLDELKKGNFLTSEKDSADSNIL